MVPPIQIERTTRGLGITPSATSNNLTPQETTSQESGMVGADGAGLSCPGSSVVAEDVEDSSEPNLVSENSVETLPQDTRQDSPWEKVSES